MTPFVLGSVSGSSSSFSSNSSSGLGSKYSEITRPDWTRLNKGTKAPNLD